MDAVMDDVDLLRREAVAWLLEVEDTGKAFREMYASCTEVGSLARAARKLEIIEKYELRAIILRGYLRDSL